MDIYIVPELVGDYQAGQTEEVLALQADLSRLGVTVSQREIGDIIAAVKKDSFILLPDGFQGARDSMQRDVFKLYTTRHTKPTENDDT